MADITMGKIIKLNLNGKLIDCDIRMPLNEKVSENFTLKEIADPTNNEAILDPLLLFVMQVLRTERNWIIIPASWYRGKKYNDSLGSNDKSQHPKGRADDFKAYKQNGQQVHPVHVAYALLDLLNRFKLTGAIGIYMPYYSKDEPQSLGFNHFDLRKDPRELWVCYKKPTLISISDLTDIKI